jgi:riboflavin biosynthesis pyrimidine reductase
VQPLRWQADAALTGVDTVLADDPMLTDRSGLRRRRPLLRVVLDSALRMPLDSKMVKTANQDLVIFTVSKRSRPASPAAQPRRARRGSARRSGPRAAGQSAR